MREVGAIIAETLMGDQTEATLDRMLARSRALTDVFPLYRTLGGC
jgi:hypothetical protein